MIYAGVCFVVGVVIGLALSRLDRRKCPLCGFTGTEQDVDNLLHHDVPATLAWRELPVPDRMPAPVYGGDLHPASPEDAAELWRRYGPPQSQ